MISMWSGRAILALAAILAPATFVRAALPTPDEAPAATSLAGQFLIASPAMGDPRFDHTVILIVKHGPGGAIGLVINRPLGERPIASLLEMVGEADPSASGTVQVFAGGPVQPQTGFVIHSTDYRRSDTIDIDGRVAVTSSAGILRDMGSNKGPKKSLVAFGYAGWGAGQLEDELAHGVWLIAPEEPALIFDEDRQKVWERAWAHRTQNL
jgi:putative transcriptional regulator